MLCSHPVKKERSLMIQNNQLIGPTATTTDLDQPAHQQRNEPELQQIRRAYTKNTDTKPYQLDADTT